MLTRPVAVVDGAQVVARNRLAADAGVAAGMRIAEAITHAANLLLLPYDARRVQAMWDVALDQLDALGPLAEDAGPGHALVDLTGAGRGERALVRRTLDALHALLDLAARAAVADGPFAASVAARRARGEREVRLIPRAQTAAFLAPLPVSLLPLPGKLLADLDRLGIRTIGAFTGLRYAEVGKRFGALGMTALSLAIGRDDRPLVPRQRERRETFSYPFEPPADDLGPVLFVTKALLDAHAAALRREGLVASGLRLVLTVEARDAIVLEQHWGESLVPGPAELEALRLTLDARFSGKDEGIVALPPPRIEAVHLTLLACGPGRGTQLPLLGAATIRQRESVAHLLTRLHALLGPDGVAEAVPVAAHLPEAQWTYRPYMAARVGTPYDGPLLPASPLLPALPGLLLCEPPEPVAVTWWGESPVALRTGDAEEAVIAALGPYCAAGGWWDGGGYEHAYWLIVTGDEALHLVREDRVAEAWVRVGVVD